MNADEVLSVVNNWRTIHAFPLNTFQNGLRHRAKEIDPGADVVQRIKRLESIHAKLVRDQTNSMRLTQMQDIGGCRAVVDNLSDLRKLVAKCNSGRSQQVFRGRKDYIDEPKADGYRSHHLIYEYRGRGWTSVYDGLKIELQLRTRLQHAWATAVEAVGIFTNQALKANQGDEDWRRFFALMGAAIAAIEQCSPVPGTPSTKDELTEELRTLAVTLNAEYRLRAYRITLDHTRKIRRGKYYVLQLDFDDRKLKSWTFKQSESQRANIMYTGLERGVLEGQNIQVVLVSADSLAALYRAYPNYFLDTEKFSEVVTRILAGDYPEPLPEPVKVQ